MIGSMLRGFGSFVKNQPVRFFALICVAVTSAFVMYMRWQQFLVLSSPDWCDRAIKAEQFEASSRLDAAKACVGMQQIQIQSIAYNSYIDGGTIALCLLSLMVIVVAGGHLSFSGPGNISANMGSSPEEKAADHVVDGAKKAAAEVKEEAKEADPGPRPAMP